MSLDAFVAGLQHPLLVPAHALALLALGLLIGAQRARLLPCAAFAAALAASLAALTLGIGPTSAGDLLLAATAVCGILVAGALRLASLLTAAIAIVIAAALGLDSPPQAISLAAASAMLIGTWIGAGAALVVVATAASRCTRAWQRIGVRILGSWIAASAILVLALRYARGLLL